MNTLAAASSSSLSPGNRRAAETGCSLALVCDLAEEKWPSMDLVAEMIFQQIQRQHSAEFAPVFLRPALRQRFRSLPVAGKSPLAHNADRLFNRMWDYPRWLRERAAQFDLFHIIDHSYAQLAFALPPERTVITCHDLNTFRCLLEPDIEPRPRWFRIMAQRILDGLCRCANVVCVSETVRAEILRHKLLPPERLSVVHNGAHPSCSPLPDPVADQLAARLFRDGELPQAAPLLLHVGSTVPRKRIDVLLKTFSKVRKHVPAARLVRVGGAFTPAQEQMISDLGIRDGIDVLPFLDRDVLSAVYRRASLVLQPSEAEGFGLPVIEALACGSHVVASDIPVLREVGGSAVTFCPVGDETAWSHVVVDLLDRQRLDPGGFENLKQLGLEQAAQFTWSRTAQNLAAIYSQVLSEKRSN